MPSVSKLNKVKHVQHDNKTKSETWRLIGMTFRWANANNAFRTCPWKKDKWDTFEHNRQIGQDEPATLPDEKIRPQWADYPLNSLICSRTSFRRLRLARCWYRPNTMPMHMATKVTAIMESLLSLPPDTKIVHATSTIMGRSKIRFPDSTRCLCRAMFSAAWLIVIEGRFLMSRVR